MPTTSHHHKPLSAGIRVWLIALPAIWLYAPCLAFGQNTVQTGIGAETKQIDPGDDRTKTESPGGSVPAEGQTTDQADLILRRADGEVLLIRPGVDVQQVLEWLNPKPDPAASAPEYDITSVSIDGTANDETAHLTARIRIQLHVDERWIPVPVGLEEATIEKTEYRGRGEISLDRTTERVRRWWIRGVGEHELELSLIVPVRTLSPMRRLQLSLPMTASSQLTMRVPMERVAVTPADGSWVETTAQQNGETQIRVVGLGSRFNLQWRPQVDLNRVSTRLQTESRSTLELTTEPATLTITQTVKALQGSFQQLAVTLPDGFELKKVEESSNGDGSRLEEYRPDPDVPGRILVRLVEPVAQSITLVWTLERTFPAAGGKLTIEPLRTADSTIEAGEIEVVALQGFRFQELERSELRRVSRPPRKGYVTTAYRFGSSNFRLVLEVLEVAPVYTVDPILLARVFEDSIQLDALFRFQVRQGAISSVDLDWPAWQREGWELQPLESLPGVAIAQIQTDGSEQIRLELEERQTSRFDIQLRAIRSLDASKQNSLHLPRLRTSDRVSSNLILGNADNIETTLEPVGETVTLPVSSDRIESLLSSFPQFMRPRRRSGIRIDSVDQEFSLNVQIQPQQISVTSRLELDRDAGLMTQFLDYNVQYETLDEVRLLLPPVLVADDGRQELIAVTDDRGTVLTRNGAGLLVGNQLRVRYRLPEARLGTFSVTVRFPVDLPAEVDETQKLTLPIVLAADSTFSRLEFKPPEDEQPLIAMDDDDWKLRFSGNAEEVWQTTAPKSELALELQSAVTGTVQAYSIRKALIRTMFDAAGYTRSRVQFRIQGAVQRLPVTVPAGIEIDAFWWNETQVPSASIRTSGRDYELRVNGTRERDSENLLTIDFHGDVPVPFEWTDQHVLEWPRLPSTVWVEQTAWEIILPREEHLFTTPAGFTPQFEWNRTGFVWQRLPQAQYSNPRIWIGGQDGPAELVDWTTGNTYIFSRFGPNAPLSFRTMKWWAVVLCGAGTTWILGLILLKAPGTRSLLTVPLIAVAVMTLGLWYPAPIQLLLQPSLLGMLLALVMAWIDSLVKQKEEPAASLTPVTGFGPAVSPSEAELAQSLGVNTEGSTAVRHPGYSGSSQLENSA